MHRLLERLDASASTLVPLLYLSGLMLGAAAYFAGITINAGLAVGIALASAAELHSFLQQRRVRANWAHLSRLTDTDAEYEHAWRQFKVNTGILIGLLVFSSFNAIAFIAETWTPAPGFLPNWLQIGVRGLVIPVFFFLAGFLSPLHTDASDQMRVTSTEMLRRTLKAIDRQWRHRLKRAEKRNADLAPVAISLLQEAGDHAAARRIELIARGLYATEHSQGLGSPTIADARDKHQQTHVQSATIPSLPAIARQNRHNRIARRMALEESMYSGHPTSPPSQQDGYAINDLGSGDLDEDDAPDWTSSGNYPADDWGSFGDDGPQMLQRAAPKKRASTARMASRATSLAVDLPAGEKTPVEKNDSPERKRVLRYLDKYPRSSVTEIAQGANVSLKIARSHRDMWLERRRRTQELAAITPADLANASAE